MQYAKNETVLDLVYASQNILEIHTLAVGQNVLSIQIVIAAKHV
jgi:hypothetical protein